jgi:hypothetical protein
MTDTYQSSFNFVTNYVLADALSVGSIAASVKGNLFLLSKVLVMLKDLYFAQEASKIK